MDLKEKARQLPEKPGVYFMKDKQNNLLYIGKAKRLNKRVISYFLSSTPQSKKNQRMIFQIADFDYQVVDTELEALLLEQKMIAQLHPPYNRLMNYSERYRFLQYEENQIKILTEPTTIAYGPFNNYKRLPEFIRILNDLYDLPDRRWHMPATLALHEKRQHLLPKLTVDQRDCEIHNTLQGDLAAVERITFQQEKALDALAFEWAKSLELDKQILLRFQRQASSLRKILSPRKKLIWDSVDEEILKIFLVYQGKILAEKKIPYPIEVPKLADFPELTSIHLPKKENFIPLNQLDSRFIVASYFEKNFSTPNKNDTSEK